MELASALDFHNARELANEYGVELWSLHLPFLPFNVIDPSNPTIADYTVEYFCSLINKAVEIGIKVFVVHPSGEPIAESDRATRLACAKKSLAALAEYATAKGAVIAVEDLPRTCLGRDSSDILELISAHPDLRVCFDTNHLLGEKIADFIANVGDKIITTHVSDYDEKNERHWLSGEGVIDWKALKDALIAVGYDGPWLYELGLSGSTSTIDRERRLEYSDFGRNYGEIMADLPITLIGKGKTDLPSWK
jgi:sugar phosphate isomerase/epimerase